jgi:hypothetical protein
MVLKSCLVPLIFLVGTLCWCIYRDIQLEKQYPGDLRNPVVGERLIQEDKLPYFYKWKQQDGIRYYDPDAFHDSKVSNITATPFFHHLLSPIANWPQRTISRFWLMIEYGMLLVIAIIAFLMAGNLQQRWAVLITTGLFLFTEAWKSHIASGQKYLFIPWLVFLFYFFVTRKSKVFYAVAAGLTAMSLVLIRPNALLFFLPFLLLIKNYPVRYWVAFCIPVVLLTAWIVGNKEERALWLDYKKSLSQHIKIHQDLGPDRQAIDPDPQYAVWEGWNRQQIAYNAKAHSIPVYSENGNFFVLVRDLLHKKIPVALLNALCVAIMAILLTAFIIAGKNRPILLNSLNVAILGYAMYMISDLFSPIFRHQYYGVQWLFPLLLLAAYYTRTRRSVCFILAAGLLLNIVNASFIKMEHTIGEYLLLLGLILFLVYQAIDADKKTKPIENTLL